MFDTAGITLLEGPQPPLHSHLVHLQRQVDTLTQTMAGLVSHLQRQPALSRHQLRRYLPALSISLRSSTEPEVIFMDGDILCWRTRFISWITRRCCRKKKWLRDLMFNGTGLWLGWGRLEVGPGAQHVLLWVPGPISGSLRPSGPRAVKQSKASPFSPPKADGTSHHWSLHSVMDCQPWFRCHYEGMSLNSLILLVIMLD